jgi:hypothetical protein
MNKLIKLLSKQEDILNSIMVIISEYHVSLIANDLSRMENLLNEEQKYLLLFKENMDIQQDLVRNIAVSLNLNLSRFSIGKFVESLPLNTRELPRLNYYRKSLKTLAEQISLKNFQSKVLIEHSRNFIKELISSLTNDKQLLDKRI